MASYYPTLPQLSLPTMAASSYTPNYQSGTPIGDIINQFSKYLKPIQSSNLQYQNYAAPQQEAFKLWETQMYRPEFERFTLNPYTRQQANTWAGQGIGQTGYGKDLARRGYLATQQQAENAIAGAQTSWEDMIRNAYNLQKQAQLASPTAMTNIGG